MTHAGIEAVIISTLSLMIIVTIVGNILVVLSVLLVKKLRHPSSNYLLVSLAFSDLCVAILVMPLALYWEVSSRRSTPGWHLGPTLCNLWVSFDVSCHRHHSQRSLTDLLRHSATGHVLHGVHT